MGSAVERSVLMIELTVPREEGTTAAHERKHLNYCELAVEVGRMGIVGKAAVQMLCSAGVTGTSLRKAVKELGEEAQMVSYWLRLGRKGNGWGQTSP